MSRDAGVCTGQAFPFQLAFVDDDVRKVFDRALESGATTVMQPEPKPWGQTIGRLRAPAGFLVSPMSART